jgi:hypothetical protein
MSLWTRVGISTVVEDVTGTLTLTEPAGVQSGDLLVACISYRQSGTQSFTAPSGWSNAAAQVTGNNTANATTSIACGRMDYIVRGGSAPALSWTRTSVEVARGQIEAWRRTDGGVPAFDQAASATAGAAGTSVSITGFSTPEEGELLIMACCNARNATASAQSSTNPGAFTERADAGSATGNDVGLAVASVEKPTAGATGNFTWTSSASARHVTIVGAFRAKYNVVAGAGSYTLTGQPTINPGVDALLVSSASDDVFVGATKTFSALSFGNAQSDRLIFAHISHQKSASTDITGVTIGGVAATKALDVEDPDALLSTEWWWAAVPTGATGDIVISLSPSGSGEVLVVNVYRVYGADTTVPISDTATDSTNASAAVSGSIDVVSFGTILAGVHGGIASTNVTYAWTNASEDADTFRGAAGISAASYWAAASESGRAITATATSTPSVIAFNKALAVLALQRVAGSTYTISATVGSYTLSGQAVGLRSTRQLTAAAGSYALTGRTAGLFVGTRVTAQPGTYTFSGKDVALSAVRSLVAGAGAYSLGGQAVGLHKGQTAIIGQGSYSLTGQNVTLRSNRITVDAGSYSFSGRAVALAWSGEPTPPNFTPAAGGGAIGPMASKPFRMRKEKSKPHEIRVGEWPTEAELAALLQDEQREFSRFIAGLSQEESDEKPVALVDQEEDALILLLSAA